jgi:hypothetical protein
MDRGWVGPRTGLDAAEYRIIYFRSQELNTDLQPVAQQYTY